MQQILTDIILVEIFILLTLLIGFLIHEYKNSASSLKSQTSFLEKKVTKNDLQFYRNEYRLIDHKVNTMYYDHLDDINIIKKALGLKITSKNFSKNKNVENNSKKSR